MIIRKKTAASRMIALYAHYQGGYDEKKYPTSLFVVGFITNLFGRYLFLLLPAVVFMLIGIWVETCLLVGLVLLCLAIALSFVAQLSIRNTVLNSDNPNFAEFQDAMLSKDWKDNIMNIMNEKMNEDSDNDEQDED